ncbi:hypothetical protein AZE42_02044 [Rhizopogon vesiculosus]|uniref:Amino acid permease/ SLC12A domain-containing protein n=1 Tax=Rhizopogon vesiculosus TaxID=180088 RepID=A0A1J8QRI9_9AGAM|nr:hypothetical protein AZE42_02044 [Rhizopogon vesiculosus]
MDNSRNRQERGPSYELQQRGRSNDLAPSEAQQANSNNHLPLDVTSTDLIAGTLGTGLFLGSGEAISTAGPLGALIAFALVGSVAYASLCSLGEMTSLAPISGTFPHFASRWVDPALGFAIGWNYFLTNALAVPAEVSGARVLIALWDTDHTWLYTLIICFMMCATNIFGIVYFAETEFIFSIIKLTMITGLIIVGLLIDLGGLPNQAPIGFNFWKNPGPFVVPGPSALEPQHPSLDHFLGILSVIVQAAFAYQGMEIVAVAASETVNPRRNITKAVRRVFYRILIFYVEFHVPYDDWPLTAWQILGIFVAGLIVPSTDNYLLSASLQPTSAAAAQSPFVIAINNANIKVLPAIVNAGMITSAFSAGNSFLFCSSRILYGLAIRGQAPHILTYCTKKGLPIVAVLCSPWLSIWGLIWCAFFILINGFRVFWSSNWNVANFITSYIDILIFFTLFFFWKITRHTEVWKPDEMDFTKGIPSYEETESPEIPPEGFWQRIAAALF